MTKDIRTQFSRKRALLKYSRKLTDVDNRMTDFVQQLVKETVSAYHLTKYLYIISFIAVLSVLSAGLYILFFQSNQDKLFSLIPICIISSVIGLIFLQSRNPVRNTRSFIASLAKLNIIFSGYIRQIHQVDIVFEDMISSEKDIDTAVTEQMLNSLQEVTTEAMIAISQLSNDIGE